MKKPSLFARSAQLRASVPVLPLAAGVFGGQLLAWFINGDALMAVVVCLGALLAFSRRFSGALIVGFVVGLVSSGVSVLSHPREWSGSDVQVLVRIEDTPIRRVPGEVTFLGREVTGLEGRLVRCRATDLPWRHASMFAKGDVVWVRGALVPIARPLNPFSWEGWLWRRGVSSEMKVLFASMPVQGETSYLDMLRSALAGKVSRITEERRGGALFLSMALGQRDVLSKPVEDIFKGFGLTHLLVVSGYQVSLMFGVVFAVCTRIVAWRVPSVGIRNLATFVALLCAAGYVTLIGAEMSAIRALIAAVCLCTAFVLDRRQRFAQRWGAALVGMQVLWPWALFDVGVILTFAALAGIGTGSVLGGQSKAARLMWMTACVWINTSLVTTVWNGGIALSGLILNLLLATPWSALNCTVGVVGLLLALIHDFFGGWIIWLVGYANECVVHVLFWLSVYCGPQQELEGASRYTVAAILLSVCVLLLRRAARACSVTSMRGLVR